MVSKPKPKARDHLLEDPQINRVEKILRTDEERLVFYGLAFTGLRISEFIHLRRSWINFKRNQIKIPEYQPCNCKGCIYLRNNLRKKLAKAEEQNITFTNKMTQRYKTMLEGNWLPKTTHSVRTITIVQQARDVLYPYFDKHKLMLEAFPLRQYINTMLTDIGKRSKVKLFPHALRGTFATMLALDNFTTIRLTEIMGWADINTALFYIKLSGAALQEEFDKKWSR